MVCFSLHTALSRSKGMARAVLEQEWRDCLCISSVLLFVGLNWKEDGAWGHGDLSQVECLEKGKYFIPLVIWKVNKQTKLWSKCLQAKPSSCLLGRPKKGKNGEQQGAKLEQTLHQVLVPITGAYSSLKPWQTHTEQRPTGGTDGFCQLYYGQVLSCLPQLGAYNTLFYFALIHLCHNLWVSRTHFLCCPRSCHINLRVLMASLTGCFAGGEWSVEKALSCFSGTTAYHLLNAVVFVCHL